ncbi:MAG: hypothetical protein IT305_14350 [Chloroflexi bacterium]|nr:hypothetical protein [Chloroflexota bacterium]
MVLALVAAVLLLSGGAPPRELRITQAAAPYAFHLVDWHLAQIGERATQIVGGLLVGADSVSSHDRAAAAAYFAASLSAREALRPAAEAAVERALTSVLLRQNLGYPAPFADRRALFPPPSFTFVSPPQVLIVSPRDRIAVVQSVVLRPDVTLSQDEQLETGVDSLGVSALVVPIGGLATYPAMVLEGSPKTDALASVAHEWTHGYLFFTPLGLRYWSSSAAHNINETTAELVGREIGPQVARELGLDSPLPAARPAGLAQDSQYRSVLRATRIEVDSLLADGKVDEAEALMRQRRDELAAMGDDIRVLNQAYFAFYGSYGDAASGSSPISRQVAKLRAQSASLGDFLRQVGQLTSADDLARAVGEG